MIMDAIGKRRSLKRILLFGLFLCLMLGVNAQAGWEKTSAGKRYYVDDTTGKRIKNGWFQVGKAYYYANKRGIVQKNKWIGNCYVKSNYKRASGWLEIDGKTYYFKSSGEKVAGKWKKIKGSDYYFQADGSLAVDQWVGEYYVSADGQMLKSTTLEIEGTTYTFDENGLSSEAAANDPVDTPTDSALGQQIVQYARKFLGGAYVYGGNNLKTGVDCSGFTQQVLAHFGIYIRRTADEQRTGGKGSYWITNYGTVKLSSSEKITKASLLQPGDLLFYGSQKPAYAGHVAIYMGGGKIIHAANESEGIIISNYNYSPVIAARRFKK